MKTVIALVLLSASMGAADGPGAPASDVGSTVQTRRPRRKVWLISVAALVAANVLDTHSSWGYPERNALLASRNGSFGGRALGLKAALIGGIVGTEWIALRRIRQAEAPFATVNLATAGMLGRTAVNNYRIRNRVSGPVPAR